MSITVKTGVEVEGYIRTRTDIEGESRRYGNTDFPRRIRRLLDSNKLFKDPHYDTGHCTEIDLKPKVNLGDFADDLKEVISQVYELCKEEDWIYMLNGSTPIAWVAGCHLHCSIPKFKDGMSYLHIKNKLYPYQPFIALLSQNSSFHQGFKEKIKDGRLYNNSNFGFATFNGDSSIDRGNGDLSINSEYNTLEIRTPSSSGYHQILACTAFIRACILQKNKKVLISNDNSLRSSFSNIIRKGGDAVIYVKLPKSLPLFNIKYRRFIPLPAGLVFYMVITSPFLSEALKEVLDELSSHDKSVVKEVFSLVSKGYSFTDFYDNAISRLERTKSICYKLHEIGSKGFLKDTPPWKISKHKYPPPSDKKIISILSNNLIKKRFNDLRQAPLINSSLYEISSKVRRFLSKVREK